MRFKGTTAFLSIVRDLRNTNKHVFQQATHHLLKQAWPDLQYARDLVGRFDRVGIDLFLGMNPDFELVVQCKGPEEAVEDRHIKDALASIRKFKASGFRCKQYWLVFNKPVNVVQFRNTLTDAITDLEETGKAEHARWMDAKDLVEIAFKKVLEDFKASLPRHNRDYLVRYAELMREGRAYMPKVPCTHIVRHATPNKGRKHPSRVWHTTSSGLDPLSQLKSEFLAANKNESGPTQVRAYRLLISEFGFGKTSLLLEFTNSLNAGARLALYVPFAELPPDAFRSEHHFVAAIYSLIQPVESTQPVDANHLPLQVFRNMLRTNHTLVLVLDGLDEHTVSYTVEGLTRIFGCIRDLVCDVVISSRAEFWVNNRGTLDHAMKGTGGDRQSFVLEEWDRGAMLSYLAEFPDSAGIKKLRSDIECDKYAELYGDIPRRPLFLEMLAEYIEDDSSAPFSLIQLYTRALERKLDRDIESPFAALGTITRPLPLGDVDLREQRRRMVRLLVQLAGSTVRMNDALHRVEVAETFSEGALLAIAREVGLEEAKSVSILLHSIIVSTNRRSLSGELQCRFAHRSYQEFFLACHLAEAGWPAGAELPSLVDRFLTELRGGRARSPDTLDEELLI